LVIERKRSIELFFRILRRARMIPGSMRGRGVWGENNLQEGHGSEMSENLIRKHYWFSGRVQGVGFRYRACYIASSLGVTGWVRNNWDERVEMEAQGTREDLARMVEMLYRQSFIGIEGVEEKVVPVEVESGFYAR
jgi:acylphosphatase